MSTSLNYAPLTGTQIAEGLRAIAAVFESGEVPELLARDYADQAVTIAVSLPSGLAVELTAASFGVDFERHQAEDDGRTYTTAGIGFGDAREVESWQSDPAYTHPVRLQVYAIEQATS